MFPHVSAWRPDNTGKSLAAVWLDKDIEVHFDVLHEGVSAAAVQPEDVGLADGLGITRNAPAQDLLAIRRGACRGSRDRLRRRRTDALGDGIVRTCCDTSARAVK